MREPKIDEIDREFMENYGVSEEQMYFFKIMYRQGRTLKLIILILLLVLGGVIYFWLR